MAGFPPLWVPMALTIPFHDIDDCIRSPALIRHGGGGWRGEGESERLARKTLDKLTATAARRPPHLQNP